MLKKDEKGNKPSILSQSRLKRIDNVFTIISKEKMIPLHKISYNQLYIERRHIK